VGDENSNRVLDPDCPRRELQSAFQRGIDNLFNRVRQLEIVDVKRKASIDGHENRLAKLERLIESKAMTGPELMDALAKRPAAPTKRQQVAEKFLDAAVGEFGYLAAADWLYQSASRAQSKDPDAYERMVKMARLLEEAAREEKDA